MKKSFFQPRTGNRYEEGFQGLRTLILGSHFYCPYQDCPYLHTACASSEDIREMDRKCPCYTKKDDPEYYRLSNSNEIELESFLEGFPYASYSAFTYLILHRRDYLTEDEKRNFWEQVAFTNYLQHYLPDGFTPDYAGHEELYDADYGAFTEVLEELKPQVVFVWGPAVKDCLVAHGDLTYLGMTKLPVLSVYVFTYEGKGVRPLSKAELKGLVSRYQIVTEKLQTEWIRKLLARAYQNPKAADLLVPLPGKRGKNAAEGSPIYDFATLIKRCATQRLIVRVGDRLAFSAHLKRLHKERFLQLVKSRFQVPPYTNEAFERMFGYRPGHYATSQIKEDATIRLMERLFSRVRSRESEAVS